MRWPKSFAGFHLPSAVCPPSEFGPTLDRSSLAGAIVTSDGDVGRTQAPVEGEGETAAAYDCVRFLMPSRSPMRWPKLVGGFHLPSALCPPSEISRRLSCR